MLKFLTLSLLFLTLSCQTESQNSSRQIGLITPKGEIIETRIAVTMSEQEKGLSGVRPGDFGDREGMLFYYPSSGEKHFWMPDTYFDLDLFYLDQNFNIIDIVRKLPHHIGRHNPELIPRARGVWCRHVLEMKASSPVAASLQIGDQLKLNNGLTPEALDKLISEETK